MNCTKRDFDQQESDRDLSFRDQWGLSRHLPVYNETCEPSHLGCLHNSSWESLRRANLSRAKTADNTKTRFAQHLSGASPGSLEGQDAHGDLILALISKLIVQQARDISYDKLERQAIASAADVRNFRR
jgi:hypothetical protein